MRHASVGACVTVVALLAVGCSTGDPPSSDGTGIKAALDALECTSSRHFNGDDWAPIIEATYDCSINDEAVALHKVGRDHRQVLDALASRYRSEAEYSPCAGQPFPTGFRVVEGEEWIVVTASADAATAVVALIGGKVQAIPNGGGPPISYSHPALDC